MDHEEINGFVSFFPGVVQSGIVGVLAELGLERLKTEMENQEEILTTNKIWPLEGQISRIWPFCEVFGLQIFNALVMCLCFSLKAG